MKARIRPPREWTAIHPKFRIPEWAPLGKAVIGAPELGRHVLAIGQTGVGKTVSVIKPLLRAAYHYPDPAEYLHYAEQAQEQGLTPDPLDELRPGALVIDPKAELSELVAALYHAQPGLRDVIQFGDGDQTQVIWYFENVETREMRSIEVADEILTQSIYLDREKRAKDPYWGRRAESLIRLTLEIDHDIFMKGGVERLKSFWNEVSNGVGAIVAATESTSSEDGAYLKQSLKEQPLQYCRASYLRPIATLFNLSATFHKNNSGGDAVLDGYLNACRKFDVPFGKQYEIMALRLLAETTYGCIISVINNVLDELASEEMAQYLSINPFEPPASFLSVAQVIDNGHFLVFTPSSQFGLADTVGRVLKTKFFAYALERRQQIRPFFYIADEAQRYISGDRISGEQSFLDRCRAYRCVSVLATQSIASLRFALAATDNGPESATLGAASLSSVLQNIGNTLYFRTIDNETSQNLMHLFPNPPILGRPHIVAVRPLSSLAVGESYYLFADGRMGRGHVTYHQTPTIVAQVQQDLLGMLQALLTAREQASLEVQQQPPASIPAEAREAVAAQASAKVTPRNPQR